MRQMPCSRTGRSGSVATGERSIRVTSSPSRQPAPIDAEEWMVIVRNDAPAPRRILHGERIAQVVFARYLPLQFAEGGVARTTERAGGFGSTGQS